MKEKVTDDIEIKLFFSAEKKDENTQSIPTQIKDAWSDFDNKPDKKSF